MRPPRSGAFEMVFVEIARPPHDLGKMRREIDHVLAGAAAGFDHIAGFAGKKPRQHRPDRLVVAVKCRRIETAVGFDRPAILAEFNDIFSHGTLHPPHENTSTPSSRTHCLRCQQMVFMLLTAYIPTRYQA